MDDASLNAARRFVASLGLHAAAVPDDTDERCQAHDAVVSALLTVVRTHAQLLAVHVDRLKLSLEVYDLRRRLEQAERALAEGARERHCMDGRGGAMR